jgi:hypothetical protein
VFVTPVEKCEACQLRAGMSVEGESIRGVRRVESRQFMFDLTAADWHNFILARSGLLVSNSPDRNYHFRPPSHEETVQQFSRVFGYIWEDVELQEYLNRSLDLISSAPPRTPFQTVDQMVMFRPEWRTLLLTGAMMFAIQAVRLNWIADEFSLVGDTKVAVLIDGEEIHLSLEDLYGIVETPGLDRIKAAYTAGTLKVRSVEGRSAVEAVVSAVLRHSTPNKPIYRVCVGSASVSVTGDHSLFGLREGALVPVRVDSLMVGSSLVVVRDGVVGLERVESILMLPPVDHTYDLSVPGPQNFVLSNGVLAHNSYSIGGVSLDLEKSSKYEGAFQSLSDQFDKQLENTKATVNIIKGLQQPRFGMGLRSAFGPYVGRGVLSPQKFIGF